MTPSEAQLFRLLDGYSKTKHQCFLAEMFLNDAKTHYVLCFRPTGVERDSPNAYSYKYLQIEVAELATMPQTDELPISITSELDKQLPSLRKPL